MTDVTESDTENDIYEIKNENIEVFTGLPDDPLESEFCDNSIRVVKNATSPNWKGEGWYKIGKSDKDMMLEKPIKPYHCGTVGSGWLNGTHPTEIEQEIKQNVCFSLGSKTCAKSVEIKILNCFNYYLYYFPETPACMYRYCRGSKNCT